MEINKNTISDDEINFREILGIISEKVLSIIFITCIALVFSLVFAISSPNKYISSSLLASTDKNNSLSSSLSGFSGLAGMAGISLPQQSASKSDEAIERIKSYNFFNTNILPFIKLEDLLAAEGWDNYSDKVLYNPSVFNYEDNKWIRKVKYPKKTIPSSQEAYKKYKEIINISQDKNTDFILVSVEHISPNLAKNWVDLIVKNINIEMRKIDQTTSSDAIKFLNESYENTKANELKLIISKLLESQMQNLMLSSSREDYIFTIIQPAVVPEEKSSPNRLLIILLGIIFGLFLGIFLVVTSFYWKKNSMESN
jgi:uncharacterized protein involved in exopolysaccharide biosynthesis